jgi:hypothetical protein
MMRYKNILMINVMVVPVMGRLALEEQEHGLIVAHGVTK